MKIFAYAAIAAASMSPAFADMPMIPGKPLVELNQSAPDTDPIVLKCQPVEGMRAVMKAFGAHLNAKLMLDGGAYFLIYSKHFKPPCQSLCNQSLARQQRTRQQLFAASFNFIQKRQT